jgi:hypothetical protein
VSWGTAIGRALLRLLGLGAEAAATRLVDRLERHLEGSAVPRPHLYPITDRELGRPAPQRRGEDARRAASGPDGKEGG